jgi:NADH-quinone oxidoreductase subunit L
MGGLKSQLPITYITFLLGTIAIAGIPPFAGFFSKDEILAHLYHHDIVMWALAIVGSALTSFYMFRVFIVTFHGDFRGTQHQADHLHESPIAMTLPLIVLAVLSVIGGIINLPAFVGGNEFLAHWLNPILPDGSHEALEVHFASLEFLAPLAAAFIPAIFAIQLYGSKKAVPAADAEISGIQKIIYDKFYIDEAYNFLFVKPVQFLSQFFYSFIDFLIIDLLVESTGKFVKSSSNELRKLQSGNIGFYIFMMVAAIAIILAWTLKSWIF